MSNEIRVSHILENRLFQYRNSVEKQRKVYVEKIKE